MGVERCPLGKGLYWCEDIEVPNFCIERCEPLWQEAVNNSAPKLDIFNEDCMRICGIEFGDEALRRSGDGSNRMFSILNLCAVHYGVEVYSEEYNFNCPYN